MRNDVSPEVAKLEVPILKEAVGTSKKITDACNLYIETLDNLSKIAGELMMYFVGTLVMSSIMIGTGLIAYVIDRDINYVPYLAIAVSLFMGSGFRESLNEIRIEFMDTYPSKLLADVKSLEIMNGACIHYAKGANRIRRLNQWYLASNVMLVVAIGIASVFKLTVFYQPEMDQSITEVVNAVVGLFMIITIWSVLLSWKSKKPRK